MELVTDNSPGLETGGQKKKLMGVTKPRIMSPKLKGKTYGPQFGEFAKKVNFELMPWQQYCANDFLTVDSAGMWKKKSIMLLLSRQQGKTTLAALLILFHMFEMGAMSIIGISSHRNMARDTFDKVALIIEQNEWLACQVKPNGKGNLASRNNGMETINLKNGAKYEICAATSDGARGKSADILFIDELAHVSEEAWAAAKPVTRARPNSMTILTSSAGWATSTVLNELRDRAMSYPAETLGWYEYSAPAMCKLDDRAAWAVANPALGYTITESALAEAFSTDNSDTFRRETLAQWVTSLSSPWPEGSWQACSDSTLAMGPGPVTYFGLDKGISKRTASLVAGQILPDGRIGVALLDTWSADHVVDDLAIAAKTKEWADRYRPVMICFDHFATASIAARLTASNQNMVDVSGTAFYQASGDLLDAIVGKRLVHSGQLALNTQMEACAVKNSDNSWRIVRRASAGDVSGPISLAMIVHKMQEPVSTPMIVAG